MAIVEQKTVIAEEIGVIDAEPSLDQELSTFRLMPENAIPISDEVGKRFQEKYKDNRKMLMDSFHQEWKETTAIYIDKDKKYSKGSSENIVKTTVDTLKDYTYMRNPDVEFSTDDTNDEAMRDSLQKTISTLITRKTYPGINLRTRMQKMILTSHLTNFGVVKLNWQPMRGSLQDVVRVTARIREQISKTTDPEEHDRLYNMLNILDKHQMNRQDMGISLKNVSPFNIIVDEDGTDTELTDSKWLMEIEHMSIGHIRSEYMVYDEETDKYFFKYDQSVEFDREIQTNSDTSKEATQHQVLQDNMPDVEDDIAKLRLKDTLPVVWVYDKVTRLVYLFLEDDWETPLWVYEDELNLSRFFCHFILAFSMPVNSIIQRSEASRYKGKMDEINEINEERRKLRNRAFHVYLYNSRSVDGEEVKKIFNAVNTEHTEVKGIGVKLQGDEQNLNQVMVPLIVPSAQLEAVFDTSESRAAIDRISRVSVAMRGDQFRTNTTNDAVATYNQIAQARTDGLTDAIEHVTEDIIWAITEILVSKAPMEFLQELIGVEHAKNFEKMDVVKFNQRFQFKIAAGSTEKPTSQNKKREATQIIQMLGQFGASAPRTVLNIVAKLLKSAFSKNLVTDADLDSLNEEAQANMQKGVSTQQPPAASPPQP